ncbi:MAG: transposase, partial [Sulfurimonas sp.]|nr:transposase [Sulfurimonas sp.]
MKAKLHNQILAKLSKIVDKRTLQQLEIITIAIMSMTGRVTMLGISRWSDKYSYKTIERFFEKKINWLEIKWGLIKGKIADKEIILVADETTISKAGKSTYGLGYFYAGLQGRAIKSIQFLSFSIVDVESKQAYPLFSKQLIKSKSKQNKTEVKKKVGRPKGSVAKKKRLKGLFRVVSWYLRIILKVLNAHKLRYFVYDGAFGNSSGIEAAKSVNLDLISKLKKNSTLYFKFNGIQKGRGRKKKYGELIDYENLDEKYCKDTKIEKDIEIKIYQLEALNRKIKEPLNIVIIIAKNLKNDKRTHTILFSTDLKQNFQKIIDYYSLRFQIEF